MDKGLIMTTCAQYKKVTVITDPLDPEDDLLLRAGSLGEMVFQQICSDGFVYLIKIAPEVEVPAILE